MKRKQVLILLLVSLGFCQRAFSDTLQVTLLKADSIFLNSNYLLLANAMNIDIQKAKVIQSKLYPNPVLTLEVNAYDPQNDKFFNTGKNGQKAASLEQLIILGGKRKAEIEMAKTNVIIAELEFQSLIRELKFQLHKSLYALQEQKQLLLKYNNQLQMLKSLIDSYEVQVVKGNISQKELVRLKTVYLGLNNQKAEIFQSQLSELSVVQVIMGTNNTIEMIEDSAVYESFIREYALDDLLQIAFENRPDYLISEKNNLLAVQYHQFQQRMAVPDLTIFTAYDQRGGAFNNQLNVGISLPLPLWNRNQGNIKMAAIQKEQVLKQQTSLQKSIEIEVQNNYLFMKKTMQEYQTTKELYNQDFELTLTALTKNFHKRNVTMLEFVDFFESYINALSEVARVKIELATSAEKLNYVTSKELY